MKKSFLLLFSAIFSIGVSKATWLPTSSVGQTPFVGLESFLSPLSCSSRILDCTYEKSELSSIVTFEGIGSVNVTESWDCVVRTEPVLGDPHGLDIYLTFTQKQDSVTSSGVALAFDFENWSSCNYVMIPCAVYNGNRNRIVYRDYAQGLDRSDLYRKDLPLTTCEVPHLGLHSGDPSKIEVNTSNTTTPAICMYSPSKNMAFILLAQQGIPAEDGMTDNVFFIEESPDRSRAVLGLSTPGVRERKPEFIGFSDSPDRGQTFRKGDQLDMRLRIYSFPAKDIPALLDKFMSVRKDVTGPNSPRKLYPMSKTAEIMIKGLDKRFYEGQFNFYRPANADLITFGWVGGMLLEPMLLMGDVDRRQKSYSTFDFAIPRAQGKAGYFSAILNYDGKLRGDDGYNDLPEVALTRRQGDVLFWMIKQFMILEAQGHEVKQTWKESMKRLADAFVNTWNKHGHWGNFINTETGDIVVYGTTGGVMAVSALALASKYYDDSIYLKTAVAAANEFYYNHFVPLGFTNGGCADILQNAESETAAGFMTALMMLYEATGDKHWLEKSRDLANLCGTWTVSFDYVLPKSTDLGRLGAKLTGSYWASTQNKHGAPGICLTSGDALFKLYRSSGDERYAELLRDITHAHSEGIQDNGCIIERLGYCDCDSRGWRGNGDNSTGWNQFNGFMMAHEIPGIYLQVDVPRIYVFDEIYAKIMESGRDGVVIEVTNPTPYDASVKVLAETKNDIKTAIGVIDFMKWPSIDVKTGETCRYKVDRNTKKFIRI